MANGKEIAVDLMCVKMRSGAMFWVERARAEKLMQLLETGKESGLRFVRFEDEMLNIADVEGVYSAATMEDLERRKNGQWKCRFSRWHDRFEKCFCHETAGREPVRVYRAGEKVFQVPVAKVGEFLAQYPQAEPVKP